MAAARRSGNTEYMVYLLRHMREYWHSPTTFDGQCLILSVDRPNKVAVGRCIPSRVLLPVSRCPGRKSQTPGMVIPELGQRYCLNFACDILSERTVTGVPPRLWPRHLEIGE